MIVSTLLEPSVIRDEDIYSPNRQDSSNSL